MIIKYEKYTHELAIFIYLFIVEPVDGRPLTWFGN